MTDNERIDEDEINLLDYWRVLVKRKMVIESIVVIACKIRVVIGSQAEYCPLYLTDEVTDGCSEN